MQTKRTLVYTFIQDGAEQEFSGILVIEHVLASDKMALNRFREIVKDWLHNTEDGRKAWEDTNHDFNFGDTATYDIPMSRAIYAYGFTKYPEGIMVNHDEVLG